MAGLLDDPTGASRQLRKSPEGIDALIAEFTEIRNLPRYRMLNQMLLAGR